MSLRYLGVVPKGNSQVSISKVGNEPDPADTTYEVLRQAQEEPPVKELATPSAPTPVGAVRLPDMKGQSLREAAKTAIGLGLKPSFEGTGTVSRQEPPPGAVLPKGSSVKLYFEPPT